MIAERNLPVNLDILSLSQLSVTEGDRVRMNHRNIEVVLDIAKYGMDDNNIAFTVVSPPRHGTLKQEVHPVERNRSFTLRDVNQEKVRSYKTFLKYHTISVQLHLSLTPTAQSRWS